MIRVELIDYTGAGFPDPYHAADILIFAKNTRVRLSNQGLADVRAWTREKKDEELAYIANTIRSSWEFVNYTFSLSGITRSLTHQQTRTRVASFAQQTMQILDVRDVEIPVPPRLDSEQRKAFERATDYFREVYAYLVDSGAMIEDARELVPSGVATSLVAKYNLRILVDLVKSRSGPRNYWMFREVARRMREEVLRVHPMFEVLFNSGGDDALVELSNEIEWMRADKVIDWGKATDLQKLIDRARRGEA